MNNIRRCENVRKIYGRMIENPSKISDKMIGKSMTIFGDKKEIKDCFSSDEYEDIICFLSEEVLH